MSAAKVRCFFLLCNRKRGFQTILQGFSDMISVFCIFWESNFCIFWECETKSVSFALFLTSNLIPSDIILVSRRSVSRLMFEVLLYNHLVMSVFRWFEFITESLDVHFICNLQESTRVDSWRLQKNGERSNRGLFCSFCRWWLP